ncbi:MAG: PucR family transcriptional regulator ligand-binding domain-containing protein, partial [Clostridia bacterium]|nr:PucR family transcriptional regulator ligand-binding domain-containing protein [Clostridia bacterium]
MRTDVTVGRIMEIPLFVENGTIFSGERGLGKPVQFVTVMETPDFNVRTLHRSTMVLTTLSAYYHRLEYVNLIIESLCKRGVAAIVIKLGRYLDEIHESTIEITKGYDTALIAIPNTVLFSRAISDVLSVVNQSQQSFISGLNELTGSLI